eukprot:NODE_3089_length_1031_cov_64.617257_g2945_i0.p1 GENE.NODE_3089_length_1031_cov_64.617257_g2945_i0~~NODE_3089_length_1031_cov_64.617257_g2945_i0.p1  ORF type:complete len:265 (+),score=58.98 NODE_3089_length_1031_cov_64.617257_g2945_i0:72-866(+)
MDPKTVTVAKSGTEGALAAALQGCSAGDTLLIKVGQYNETLVLTKDVHVVGDAEVNTDVVITGGSVCTAGGSIKNLTIHGCVEIRSGDVCISNCDISQGADGIRVQAEANPTLFRNTIHNVHQGGDGIYFNQSKGTAEENSIHHARVNGIHVNNGEVTLRANHIHDCHFGIYFRHNGYGLVEGNEINSITSFGIYLTDHSDPIVRANRVAQCGVHVLLVSQEGKGDVAENAFTGSVVLKKHCVPVWGPNTHTGRFENENTTLPD